MTAIDVDKEVGGLQSSGAVDTAPSVVAADIPWATQATQSGVSDRLNLWSTAAGALSPKMLLQFAEAGISPTDPVGQWVIKTGVPALGSRQPAGASTADSDAAAKVLSSPGILFQLAQLPLDQMTNALKLTAAQVGQMNDQQLQHYLANGSPVRHHGFFNKIGDYATTGVRDTLGGLQAGAETVSGAFKARVAEGSLDPTAGAVKGGLSDLTPAGAQQSMSSEFTPKYGQTIDTLAGGHLKFGTPEQNSPFNILTKQTTLGQAIVGGNSLGNGFFPAGVAHEQAVLAQQSAASINGHALTPGRALAGSVLQPGSRPFQLMSGIVDTEVALKGDPSSIVLSHISDAAKEVRMFAPTSDAARLSTAMHLGELADNSEKMNALRDWAGVSGGGNLTEAMLDKMKRDPGSLQQLVEAGIGNNTDIARAIAAPHAGMFDGLRQAVSPKDALTWLNNRPGRKYADWAASHDFYDIWEKSGYKMPADVAASLGDATNADDVRTILGAELGTTVKGVPETALPYAWKRPFPKLRMATLMPHDYIGTDDVQNMVQQGQRYLALASVPRSEWNDILKPIAQADDATAYDAFVNGVYGRVQKSIEQHMNVPDLQAKMAEAKAAGKDTTKLGQRIGNLQDLARKNTRAWADMTADDKQRWISEVVGGNKIPGGALDGGDLSIDGVHRWSELLNSAIPALPNPRDIRHLTSAWAPIYEHGIVDKTMTGFSHINDYVTGAFKVGALAKLALPVRFLFDEQARMATAGYDSMFHHPLSYMAWAIGGKGDESVLGESWQKMLADRQSMYKRAIGNTSRAQGGILDPVTVQSNHYTNYSKDSPQYIPTWADNLSAAHADPATAEVARAMRDPDNYIPEGVSVPGVEGVKEWFWSGPGKKFRADLAASGALHDEGRLAADRTFSDQYVDSLIDRLKQDTRSHPALIDAVADGHPFVAPGQIDKGFKQQLRNLSREVDPTTGETFGPTQVRGKITLSTGRRAVMDNMVDRMFGFLMDKPAGQFTRDPFFKQSYFKDIQRTMPYMDRATQDTVIEQARAVGVKLTRPAEAQGVLNLQKADKIAQASAFGEAKKLLYYHAEKSNAADALRAVFPFANAMKSVITSWAKLVASNPVAVRRVQQGVTSLRDSGFFYKDPADGVEKFNLVPGSLMEHLGGVPFPLSADVKGLNIAGAGLPGVGPAVQIPAAAFMPHIPVLEGLRKHLLPYGDPDYSGGFYETLFPGWFHKLQTSGWMMKVDPNTGEAKGALSKLPFFGQSSHQAMVLANLAKQVLEYKTSSGSYDLSNPDVLNQLTKDSMNDAQKLYFITGAAQFIAPAAPRVIAQSGTGDIPAGTKASQHIKDGSLIESWKLTNDYNTMLAQNHYDTNVTTQQYIEKWGANRLFATEPLAKRVLFGVPTTAEAQVFKEQHGDFVSKFPKVYGYFAPQTGQFDYSAYLDAIKRGDIRPLRVDEWAKLAESRLGNSLYDQARQKLPASPSQDQRNWLDKVKQEIIQQQPGWGDQTLKNQSNDLNFTIDAPNGLRRAITDPTVKGSPLADSIGMYIEARDKAVAAARARTGNLGSGLTSQRDDDLRQWLYQVGTQIATQHPEFTAIWDDLFLNEVQPPTGSTP